MPHYLREVWGVVLGEAAFGDGRAGLALTLNFSYLKTLLLNQGCLTYKGIPSTPISCSPG